ncbi:LPS export ABC transporter periplasmic protein LptC [Porphyromonas macacae]|uniref:LPS export ABC transporter periplasmic protein LptC n=1 Tax=Porphyromonas macacae TaxID=28115 RepID=UPI00068D925A|nr:LPS export ABC transporter periplasmic protein LptC [Porphyromonas macacae]
MDELPTHEQRRLNKYFVWHTSRGTSGKKDGKRGVCHTLLYLFPFSIVRFFLPVAVVLSTFAGCGGTQTEEDGSENILDTMFSIKTTDVSMLVSDSGVVQYKLDAAEWLIYDKPEKKQWLFNKGFYLENFDTLKNVKAMVSSDTAIQYVEKELWELIGHVVIKDLQGNQVYSPHLFWDKKNRNIYSNDSIYIMTPDRILRGNSFWGKDDLSEYTLYESSGIIDINEDGYAQEPVVKSSDSLNTNTGARDSLQKPDSIALLSNRPGRIRSKSKISPEDTIN